MNYIVHAPWMTATEAVALTEEAKTEKYRNFYMLKKILKRIKKSCEEGDCNIIFPHWELLNRAVTDELTKLGYEYVVVPPGQENHQRNDPYRYNIFWR